MVDRIALLWDIDGTLLSTARAGVWALESAVLAVTGRSIPLEARPTAGRTDSEIFSAILTDLGMTAETAVVAALLRHYATNLPTALHRRRGGLMPGVEQALTDPVLAARCEHMLLTGNYEPSGRAKLAHYGIADRFSMGWFCLPGDSREMISRRAAAELDTMIRPRRIIIGDTVHDARCAAAAGIPCLGIAADPAVRTEMTAAGAAAVFPVLHEPTALLDTLEHLGSL